MITTKQPISWPPPSATDVVADALQMGVAGAKSAVQGAVAWVPPCGFMGEDVFTVSGFWGLQGGRPKHGFG